MCQPIKAAPSVKASGNPLFTVQQPLPILGSPIPLGLNWCFQLTKLQLDFHPGNVIALPAELGVLQPQRFALVAQACFGLDCPGDRNLDDILRHVENATVTVIAPPKGKEDRPDPERPKEVPPTIVLPHGSLLCFCLKLYVVGHIEWGNFGSRPGDWLKVKLDGIEIVDLGPDALESSIECYLANILRMGILPRLSIPLESLVLDVTKTIKDLGVTIGESVSLRPAATSAAIPNNPAVENDQLKAFIELVILP
jgi:hypothetical protein